MSTIAKFIIVKGKVQGVFYRKFTKQKAIELGVKGWVKNSNNGDVEIFAQGDEDTVEQLIAWCWQGSPKANVENVILKDARPVAGTREFSIEH